MSFKHTQSVSKFFSRFVGLVLLLTLSGGHLAQALPPDSPQEEAARLTPDEAIAVALDGSAYSEIGSNDMRLSDMGQFNIDYDAGYPAVAYNSTDNEYLVVWSGSDNTGSLGVGEFEIFGQRVDAATGAEVGTNDFRLSNMGPDGNHHYGALNPAVAYNSAENEYLVVWRGDDTTDDEFEIFGQRVNGATGAETGVDFRISDMGPDGDTDYGAYAPAVAYNSTNNEYLVVWSGDDDTSPLVDEEFEIFGQRLDATTGAHVGTNDFRISDMGSDGDAGYDASRPAVAYNSAENEYLVVWQGDDTTNDEFEIYGQRVDAATGTDIGGDLRYSDMGPDGDPAYNAYTPAVAYNPTGNQYLVVWWGSDNTGALHDDEYEIYGQRVNAASGAEIGDDFRISDMGPDGNIICGAINPAVAYNSANNEYLVVWEGRDDSPSGPPEEEIYGQRVNAASGAEVGTNDFRLSDMGPEGAQYYDAFTSAVAYNDTDNEYLVVWMGDDAANEEFEIYGQRVNAATGAQAGANDFRLSDMWADRNYDAWFPAVAYNSTDNEYLVVWVGDDDTGDLVAGEYEIYGQRVDAATGAELGTDFRISNMGPDGDSDYDAEYPAVAYNSAGNEYLVVWSGDDNTGGLVNGEYEVYGQRVDGATGFEIGDDFRLSDMGPDGSTAYYAKYPDIAYNPTNNEYLVVWEGHDGNPPAMGEKEIYGQRVNAATGAEIGDDFRLSTMGPIGNLSYEALNPAVAYNSAQNEYLVVWWGDDDAGALVDDEYEIYGQRVDAATGAQVGTNDFRLSDMGPDGNGAYDAGYPAVAYNGTDNEYLVVWSGDDDTGKLVDGELEVFGQRVEADGDETGTSDFRISDMGPGSDADYGALSPAVAYNSAQNEYLVVWWGDDDTGDLVEDEFEIFGQRLDAATGAAVGDNDFRLSDMGPDGDPDYDAEYPAVAYGSADDGFLVVWQGDDNRDGMIDGEDEIFGQRLGALCVYLPLVVCGY